MEFSTIRISVKNVAASRNWYKAFWDVDPVEDLENFVSFRLGRINLDISLADEKSPVSNGGCVGYWLVDDLDRAVTHAQELGAKIYRGPLKVEEVKRTIVQLQDPFGNVFGLEAKI